MAKSKRKRLPIKGVFYKHRNEGWKVINAFSRDRIQVYNPLLDEYKFVSADGLGRPLTVADAWLLNKKKYPDKAKELERKQLAASASAT